MSSLKNKTKVKKVKAWMATNPTKFDDRYKATWFDVDDFWIDHKNSLFMDKKAAKMFIENRVGWVIVPCVISYKIPNKK